MLAFYLSLALQDSPNPNLLPIGPKGVVEIAAGLTSLKDGQPAEVQDVVKAAQGISYVFVGEQHDQAGDHLLQARVIRALQASGREVVVGFEMFTRPAQINLAPLTLNKWTLAEFEKNANWKTEWGFDFALYQPIFEAVRDLRLPMVALNVPREWVRAVSKNGPNGLSAEQQSQVPPIDLTNSNHEMVFNALMGGHPMGNVNMKNIYASQVLWDTAMADSAVKYMANRNNKNLVMVICAGSGHGMYKQGINYRIKKQTGADTLTVICVSGENMKVSKGLGDFVFRGVNP